MAKKFALVLALILFFQIASAAYTSYVDVREYIPNEFKYIPREAVKPQVKPQTKPQAKPDGGTQTNPGGGGATKPGSNPAVKPGSTNGNSDNEAGGMATVQSGKNIDYLSPLNCANAVSTSDCNAIKSSLRTYSEKNFPYICKNTFTPEKWALVLYWQLYAESTFNRYAYPSGSSARGICQFLRETALEYHLYDPMDDAECIRAMSEYMRDLAQKPQTKCDLDLTVAAYHVGPNGDIRRGEISAKGQQYVNKILPQVESTISNA
ncbi:MAG: lytic transglycosylase domain-containing protein [Candidatus Micrarchaeota archaeon]